MSILFRITSIALLFFCVTITTARTFPFEGSMFRYNIKLDYKPEYPASCVGTCSYTYEKDEAIHFIVMAMGYGQTCGISVSPTSGYATLSDIGASMGWPTTTIWKNAKIIAEEIQGGATKEICVAIRNYFSKNRSLHTSIRKFARHASTGTINRTKDIIEIINKNRVDTYKIDYGIISNKGMR